MVSKAKFWAGIGALETHDGKIYDRVLSPKQFEGLKATASWEKVNLIDLPNFKEVPVFPQRLNFQ